MSSLLDRLCATAAVLLAAVAAGRKHLHRKQAQVSSRAYRKTKALGSSQRDGWRGKKKTRRKPAKRPTKKRQREVPSRAARRVSGKSERRKKKSASKAKKLAAGHKESLGGEPLPKPNPPIGRAILISPEDGKYVDSVNPTFRWLSVGGATRYEVLWGDDPGLSNGHSTISLATEAAVPVEKPLRVGATYYWRVRGGNDGGWGPWSPTASFRVLEETT